MLLKKEKQKKNIQERFSSPFLFLDSLQKNKTKTISLPETAEKNKTQKKSTFCHWKKLSFLKKSLALSIIFALVTAVYFQNSTTTQGASYTFTQTNWAGGVTANNATHTSNQTGWTEYSAKDANLTTVNAGADLQVGTQTNTWTVTDDGTTDTGFNNTGAVMGSAVVSGTGSGAGVTILQDFPRSVSTNLGTQQLMGINEGESTWGYNYPFFVRLPDNKYRMYYAYYTGTVWNIVFRDTTDTNLPNSTNIGVQTVVDSTSQVLSPFIIRNTDNKYRMYYAYFNGTYWQLVYRDTTDTNLPTSTNLDAQQVMGIGTSASDFARMPKLYQLSNGKYRLYYTKSNGGWRLVYRDTTDTNLPSSTSVNIGVEQETGLPGTNSDSEYSSLDVVRLSDGTYRLYYSHLDGVYRWLAYRDTTDTNLPNSTSTNIGTEQLMGIGTGATDQAHGAVIVLDSNSTCRLYYGYYNGSWRLAYRDDSSCSSSGTFTSHAYDTTANISLGILSWTATTPTNTAITIKARSGNQSNLSDATAWASCTNITSGAALSTGGCITNGHRYLQFQATLSTTDTSQTPTLSDVSLTYTNYPTAAQTLTSSAYNSTSSANVISRVSWNEDASLPTSTNIQFQLRTAPDSSGSPGTWTSFLGPDGTNGTYFSNSGTGCSKASTTVTCTTIPSTFTSGSNDQWIGYKTYLTRSATATPTLSDITLGYVANASPQFDTTFNTTGTTATQNSDGTVTIQYQIRDPDTTTGTITPNAITPSFEYSTNGGTGYSTITSGYLGASDLTNKTVGESSYTLYSATWNPKNQLGSSTYVTNAKIRVTINDNEAANNTANAATANFTLDTTNPTSPSVAITTNNNAAAPGSTTLTLSATDNSSLQMKVGLVSDLSDASWETYATSKTITLATDPDTVYAQFKDAYGNTSSIVSATTPETPTAMMVQDTSNFNLTPNELRLFIAWKVTAAPSPGFKRYNILRSTDNSAFSSIATVTDINTNYYADSTVAAGASYYYKVSSQDNNDNLSFFSSTIQAKADGIQNLGEGGGGTDSTGPTISSVTSSSIQTTQATITWTTNELSSSTVGFSEDTSFTSEQGVASYVTSHSVTLTGLTPNTAYKFQVKSTDPTGNLTTDNNSSAGYTFTTANGPAISNVTVKQTDNTQATIVWRTDIDSSTYVTYGTAVSNGSITDGTETGTTALIGGSAPFTHTKTITALAQGIKYYFSVKSIDSGNNTAVDNNGGNFYQFTTTVDTANPIISGISVIIKSDTEAAISWTTDEPATSQVKYSLASGGPYTSTTISSTYDTSHYVILTGLTADTPYYYKVVSNDINTNSTTSSESSFTTKKSPSYQHDPITEITDIADPPDVLTDTKAVLNFTTDQSAKCSIESGTQSGSYTEVPVSETDYNAEHSVHLTGLIFSTKYYYRITCADNLDNTVSSSEKSFTTSEKLYTESGAAALTDTTAPDISKVKVKEITGETVTVTWETNEEGSSSVKYGTETIEENMAGNASVNSDVEQYIEDHSVIVNGLIPATKYKYAVLSVDASGNIAKSSEATFTTTSPSSLTSVKVLSKTLGEALISWKTSKETTSIAEYGKDEDYGEKKENNNLTKEHELTLSKLESGETYHFRVKGEDKDKNLYASNDYTFIPKSPPKIETQKTEKLEEHTVEIQFTTDIPTDALITYTNKDNPEETGSQGNPKNETSHIVTLKNLTPGTTYQTKIKARDTEGNESETDGPEFTTGKDENPPKIDQIRTDSALTQNDKVQTIISWTTDESADTALTYKEGRNGNEKDLKINDQFTTPHIAVLTSFKSGTVYYFKAKSTDQSGNTALSGEYALLTPKRKENIVQVIVNNFQEIFGWMR